MVLKLVCLPIRAARCGVRVGFLLGVGVGIAAVAGACALALAAKRARTAGD